MRSSTLNSISLTSSTPPISATGTVPFTSCVEAIIAAASVDDSRCVMVMLNPRSPHSMAIWLPGAFATDSANSCGGAREAPFSTYSCMYSTDVCTGPNAVPIATPLSAGKAPPLSSMASFAAATPIRDNPFIRRIFIGAMKSFALKSLTSAALCAASPTVSKRSTSRMVVRPLASNARNASTPTASGATTPIPVMGMRGIRAPDSTLANSPPLK